LEAERRNGAPIERVLPRSFFERHTLEVARELLGKLLIARGPGGEVAGRIVETEAYRADDPASHSCRGETPRAAIMFGPPGVAYVYFIYGMYEMLNFVTEPEGQAGAVLIRALEPVRGEELMRHRRALGRAARAKPLQPRALASGPGKLCRALGIGLAHNGASLRGPALRVADDGYVPEAVSVSPRVGITQAVEKPWRFFIDGNACVSRAPQNRQARPWRAAGARAGEPR
jgi:DNA-3-methyladenine glycosylase